MGVEVCSTSADSPQSPQTNNQLTLTKLTNA